MTRAVRVVTEVAAVDRAFDYEVPETFPAIHLGDRVRMNFHGRSVRGWVHDVVAVDPARPLKPLTKSLGFGPPAAMLSLLEWAAWRWASPLSRFLLAASPTRIVTTLPTPPAKLPLKVPVTRSFAPGVWQVAPNEDPLGLICSAYEQTRHEPGSLLVLVPTDAWAQRVRGRLEQRGLSVAAGDEQWDRMRATWPVIVGARGTALAPTTRVCGAVIIDADDEAFRSESSPTWDAVSMVAERCRRDAAPLWLSAVLPSPVMLACGDLHSESDSSEAWPTIAIVDKRNRDPHDGVLSEPALSLARAAVASDESVAVCVILQRLGAGRLFACRRCGELARCGQCRSPEQEAQGRLACPEGHGERENFCLSCGATNLKRVQSGVTTLARDIAAQLNQPVTEVTAQSADGPLHRVVVGTEAVFSRVRRCGLVIFVDFDQYLLAPRASARRHAVQAVARAGRLVGPRSAGRGSVVVQTRRDDEVIAALRSADVGALRLDEVDTAVALQLPPFAVTAEISGEGAPAFLATLDLTGLKVSVRDDVTVVRAATAKELCDVLATGVRSGGRLRLAVS